MTAGESGRAGLVGASAAIPCACVGDRDSGDVADIPLFRKGVFLSRIPTITIGIK